MLLSFSALMVSCDDDDDDFVACTAEAETANVMIENDSMASVYTDIVIEASPEEVWQVLTDFEAMPSWSTTFQGLEGDITDGGQINALFPSPQGMLIAYPHALDLEEGLHFGWSDEIITLPGIVDNHYYTIEPCGDETLFIQTDEFSGNNENLTAAALANAVLAGYQTFNRELKQEVER